VAVCPVDCIPKDPEHPENHAGLLAKFHALTAAARDEENIA
jgi:hypothetical protein